MPKQFTSTKSIQYAHYNRWRAKHREIDRRLRLAKIEANEQAKLNKYVARKTQIPRKPAAWATVIIRFKDGTKSQFSIHETPWSSKPLTISPTLAGRKVTKLLTNVPSCD